MQNVASCERNKNGDFVVTHWNGRTETVSKEEAVARPVKVGPPEREYEDISRVIYLCNSIGEPIDHLPGGIIPMLPPEKAWWGELEANDMYIQKYVVQLPTGERGILLAEEICQPESDSKVDQEIAAECGGWKTAEDAWRWVLGVAEKWKQKGFRVFIGYKTGPFDRHELGVFISWDKMSIKKCKLADDIFRSCRGVPQPAKETKTSESQLPPIEVGLTGRRT